MEKGIKNYVRALDKKELPKTLRGQKFRIFGNIENIYKFHKLEFLPKLKSCNENISEIADTFITYLQKDYFYIYVLFAINSKKSERICNNHIEFFLERINTNRIFNNNYNYIDNILETSR